MSKRIIMTLSAGLVLLPSIAFAQASTATGAVGGAAAGAAIGGPVGAVVGGVAGAAIGASMEPPREVVTYVESTSVPSVSYDGRIVVGETLPETVIIRPVPKYDAWSYAYVNQQRVIVDPTSRKIAKVIP